MYLSSVTRLGDLLDFGQLLKPLATINLPKSLTFLGNFCKVAKIFNFSCAIIFGQLLQTFGDFFLVTLYVSMNGLPPVLLVWIQVFSLFQINIFTNVTYLLVWLNRNQSNRRSAVPRERKYYAFF